MELNQSTIKMYNGICSITTSSYQILLVTSKKKTVREMFKKNTCKYVTRTIKRNVHNMLSNMTSTTTTYNQEEP